MSGKNVDLSGDKLPVKYICDAIHINTAATIKTCNASLVRLDVCLVRDSCTLTSSESLLLLCLIPRTFALCLRCKAGMLADDVEGIISSRGDDCG